MPRISDLIDRKRRGERLSRSDLEALVLGYTRDEVPDYQVAAWLMAVCWRGLEPTELADLTAVMVESGEQLDLSSLGRITADKHSTGGVGDKTSLVVVPILAACGLPVAKMSGRGLGFTGGTLDKLEAVPGLQVELEPERLLAQVQRIGLAIVGQSPRLAPADGRLYALRDVTATIESIPLLASSIMSKKLAAGAQVIVLDVKVGSGAFLSDPGQARQLAEAMVAIGRAAGRRTCAFITDMSQPLGQAVGNALELVEVIETLRGSGPGDLRYLALVLAGEALTRAGLSTDRRQGEALAEQTLSDGSALERLAALVREQEGDEGCIWEPSLLPRARLERRLGAERHGLVVELDARRIAETALLLGAGRERKGDRIDPAVGLVLAAKRGEQVQAGQTLAILYANDEARLERAEQQLRAAFRIDEAPVPISPLIHWRSD
jgi:pyrimidine-nucleoside phosphorylase